MEQRATTITIIFSACVAILASMFLLKQCLWPSESYRFRMTVEVETPQGQRYFSSVVETSASKVTKVLPEEHYGRGGMSGDLPVLELRDGPVFVLAKICDDCQLLNVMITQALSKDLLSNPESVIRATRKLSHCAARRCKAELPRKHWPILVRFRNIKDAQSVEQVEPESIKVKHFYLETTEEQITALPNRYSSLSQTALRTLSMRVPMLK